MDNILLQASVHELRREILGLPVHRLVPHGPDCLTLLLGAGWSGEAPAAGRARLYLSLLPDLPLLHLSHRRAGRTATPTPFQALVARELQGTWLRALGKEPWERVVTLAFHATGLPPGRRDRQLVVELLGSRANLLLLDGDRTVLGHARPLGGGRDLRVGATWRAPAAGDRRDPAMLDEETFRSLVSRAGTGIARALGRGLQGQSPALCREVERRARAGEDPWALFRDLRDRILEGDFEPRLYVSAEWARILRRGELPEDLAAGVEPLVTALRVEPPPGMVEVSHARAGEALDEYRVLRLARMELRSRCDSLAVALRRECSRLERLAEKLASDQERSAQERELQRRGEILLAGLGGAQADGDRVTLPDPYDPEGGTVTVELDPRLSLTENAQRYFRLARKARRGRKTVARRLEEVRERLPRLRQAAGRLERAVSARQVEELEASLARDGLLRLVRRQRARRLAPRPGRAPEVLPVRSYTSADGMEVLMGRTGKENDLVTFQVAAPHDFWFHARGLAGAHVVVRNPSRLGRLPEATARQAAMLAAYHSKARGSGRVDVIFTQRRHVRKGRGQPAGRVRVQRHETLQVPPEMPFGGQEV